MVLLCFMIIVIIRLSKSELIIYINVWLFWDYRL